VRATRLPARGAPRRAAPVYWTLFFVHVFHVKPTLADELWWAFQTQYPQKVQSIIYHLEHIGAPATSLAVLDMRLQHFAALIPPTAVLGACGVVSPEGPGRRTDVIQFEDAMLRHVDQTGGWRL